MTDSDTERFLPPSVCFLGLGLIGGSLMRALSPHLPTSGWSRSEETRAAARADGHEVFDDLDEALTAARASDALIVLAAPLTAFPTLIGRVGELAPRALLTDVGGVKGPVAEQVEKGAPSARYIGSHPMAGTQFSGWAAGSADLFRGTAWVTTMDDESDAADWLPVAAVALTVGARIIPTEAAAHDLAVARISHLPHLLACALAQAGHMGGSLALALAASSFADGTRVAATRPELIRAMCEGNQWPLVDALDDVLALLGVARGSLASTGSLDKLTAGGHQGRLAFEARGHDLERVTVGGDDLIEQLLAIGAAGGHVTAIAGDRAAPEIEAWYPAEPEVEPRPPVTPGRAAAAAKKAADPARKDLHAVR